MAGQEGIEPVVKVWGSLTEEAEFIAHCISTWVAKGKDNGIELKDIAVVYTSKAVGDSVEKALSKAKLDHRCLKNSYQKRHSLSQDARVKIRWLC
jgi:ATP-dependent exoDNAse (exonuclease V) beta subunit